jgi:hypothetical protein
LIYPGDAPLTVEQRESLLEIVKEHLYWEKTAAARMFRSELQVLEPYVRREEKDVPF